MSGFRSRPICCRRFPVWRRRKISRVPRDIEAGAGYLSFANLIAQPFRWRWPSRLCGCCSSGGSRPDATHRAALALACLAPGPLLFSMTNILARAFYALNDIKTPMKISILCLCLNLAFALWLVRPYREAGLGVANTLSAVFNVSLLFYTLRRKLARLEMAGLAQNIFTLLGAAVLAGGIAFLLYHAWDGKLGHATLAAKIGAVFVPSAIAGLVYWLIAAWAKIPAAKEMSDLFFRRLGRGSDKL
jgi:putative peptidoglycan lipid II flippase